MRPLLRPDALHAKIQPCLPMIFEHVEVVRAAGLEHLHVVLDRDDRVGHAFQPMRRERAGLGSA